MNREMKKWLAVGLAAIFCMGAAACGGKSSGKQPAAAEVVKAVAAQMSFSDTMSEGEQSMFTARYEIDAALLEDQALYVGTLATADELMVMKLKDQKDVQAAKDAISAHLEDQKFAFETYIPEEMPKIENAVVLTNGNYVLLAVAADTSKVEETFKAQF